MADLPFGDWLPDLPANMNPGALLAKNCLPLNASYGQFKSLQPFATAIGNQARGNYWLRNKVGQVFNYVGDATKLYAYNGSGGWADVSKPATVYSADNWDFINFQDRVIATDGGASNIQYIDAGTGLTFDDLPGNPPRAKVVGVVRDFVVLGNYAIGAEVESGGLAWSGFNQSGNWTPTLSTQSGRRRTRGTGGEIKRIISGTQGLVFRESAILLLSYIGSPNVFQVDEVTTLHGTPSGTSVAWTKDLAFYYSSEGFHQINRRTLAITPIGNGKVDEWFRKNAALGDIVNMKSAIHRTKGFVYWVFRSTTSTPYYDRILVYNWNKPRFTYAELQVEHIGEFASLGYNLDTIGAVLGGNIDSASIPVDSDAYAGGDLSLLGFDPSHISGTFDGPALTAEIDTTEFILDDAHHIQGVNHMRPIIETSVASTVEGAVLTRNRTVDSPVLSPFVAMNAIGAVNVRSNARYMRYRVRIAGGFDHAWRCVMEPKKRGRR